MYECPNCGEEIDRLETEIIFTEVMTLDPDGVMESEPRDDCGLYWKNFNWECPACKEQVDANVFVKESDNDTESVEVPNCG